MKPFNKGIEALNSELKGASFIYKSKYGANYEGKIDSIYCIWNTSFHPLTITPIFKIKGQNGIVYNLSEIKIKVEEEDYDLIENLELIKQKTKYEIFR